MEEKGRELIAMSEVKSTEGVDTTVSNSLGVLFLLFLCLNGI